MILSVYQKKVLLETLRYLYVRSSASSDVHEHEK
jgi:hypothetical protein